MSERALATIERVIKVYPIEGADAIEGATVRGWEVVVKKGEFLPGDSVVYFEVDSMLDVEDPRFAFLAARGVRTNAEGRKGHVLKTARLRGQYSQGLVLPIEEFPEIDGPYFGQDVTDQLGIIKWEPPLPPGMQGKILGGFPTWIPKTDEERIQNVPEILTAHDPEQWVATEKIDGTSTTFAVFDGTYHVYGRNWEQADGMLWDIAAQYDIFGLLEEVLVESPLSGVALQGETYGEGIQGNPLGVKGRHFKAFNLLFKFDDYRALHMTRERWGRMWPGLKDLFVPVYDGLAWPESVEAAVEQVDGIKSLISPERNAEGVVWRLRGGEGDDKVSVKVISRKYLLKHDN